MNNKLLKLLIFTVLILSIVPNLNAQKKPYSMWESVTLTPDNTKLKVLSENMRKHNLTYHSEGVYEAHVYIISTGPNIGQIVWEMGPLNFSHLDNRPSGDAHYEDWRDNIMPYVKKMEQGEYWRIDAELSNTKSLVSNAHAHPILLIRYYDIEVGKGEISNKLLAQMSTTVKKMNDDHLWSVYYNEFSQGNTGRHIATVSAYESWTDFDNQINNFKETYIAVFGEDAWLGFLGNMDETYSNSWDEIWTFNAVMSGK